MNKVIFVAIVSALLGGCSMHVNTLYDPATDFSKYKTFCWMSGCEFSITGPPYLNDSLIRENIKKTIISQLNKKGLILDNDKPDLLISFNITVKNEQSIVYHREDEVPFSRSVDINPEVINYLKGTIIIGMADKKNSKVVWESFASNYMELNPDVSEKNIARGISLIMKKYPPHK